MAPELNARIQDLRRIARNGPIDPRGGPIKVEGMLVDKLTAQVYVMVHDALKPENQRKLERAPFSQAVEVVWNIAYDAGIRIRPA